MCFVVFLLVHLALARGVSWDTTKFDSLDVPKREFPRKLSEENSSSIVNVTLSEEFCANNSVIQPQGKTIHLTGNTKCDS